MFKVIIVEDDPMVATLNKQYLEKASHELNVVTILGDGASAFNYLVSHQVDLMILDVYMPTLTGLELLKKVRSYNLLVDIIMVTAANNSEEVNMAFTYGVIDYLVKPFDYKRFAQAVDKFLHKRSVLNTEVALSQEAIDIMSSSAKTLTPDLQKGLQPLTLAKIQTVINQYGINKFTCKEISDKTNLSAVTAQRYLSYLVNAKQLMTTIDYNTGGRPKLWYTKLS